MGSNLGGKRANENGRCSERCQLHERFHSSTGCDILNITFCTSKVHLAQHTGCCLVDLEGGRFKLFIAARIKAEEFEKQHFFNCGERLKVCDHEIPFKPVVKKKKKKSVFFLI